MIYQNFLQNLSDIGIFAFSHEFLQWHVKSLLLYTVAATAQAFLPRFPLTVSGSICAGDTVHFTAIQLR